jgi:hypothetical protein
MKKRMIRCLAPYPSTEKMKPSGKIAWSFKMLAYAQNKGHKEAFTKRY